MDNDLNIANALAHVFDFVKEINTLQMNDSLTKTDADEILKTFEQFDTILGVLETQDEDIPEEITKMVEEREQARKEKDFEKADSLRDQIKDKGYVLEDSKDGIIVKRV